MYRRTGTCKGYTVCGTVIVAATAGNVDVGADSSANVFVANATTGTITKYTRTSGFAASTVLTTANTINGFNINSSNTLIVAESVTGGTSVVRSYASGCARDACSTLLLNSAALTYVHLRYQQPGNINVVVSTSTTAGLSGVQSFSTQALGTVNQLVAPASGTITSVNYSSASGASYATFVPTAGAGTVYITPFFCVSTTCTFGLPGSTRPSVVVATDLDAVVDVYDALGTSNQVLDYATGQISFTTTSVGAANTTLPISYFGFDSAGTLGSVAVRTNSAANLDFTAVAAGTTCNTTTGYVLGNVCAVQVQFAPKFPSFRVGAVVLGSAAQASIAQAPYLGLGAGALAALYPGTLSTGGALPAGSFVAATDDRGVVYVSNATTGAITLFTPAGGSYVQSKPFSGVIAGQLAVDGPGNVYLVDASNRRVLKETLSFDGTYTQSVIIAGLPTGETQAFGLAVANSGTPGMVYVASAVKVYQYITQASSSTGYQTSPTNTYTIPGSYPSNSIKAVAVDAKNGSVYAADAAGGNVYKFTSPAANPTVIATGTNNANGLAFGADGSVYVSDQGNNRILRLVGFTTYTQYVVNTSTSPNGIALSSHSDLYTVDSLTGMFTRIDPADAQAFNFTNAGGTIYSKNFQLFSNGYSPLSYTAPTVSQGAFSIDPNNNGCKGGSLQTAPCTVGILFRPSAMSTYAGTLSITNNSLGVAGSTLTSALTGTGGTSIMTQIAGTFPATSVTAGTATTATFQTQDQYGAAFAYNGSATITSTDSQAVFTTPATFTNGVATVPVTFKTAGTRSLTAVSGGVTGNASTTVTAAAAATLTVSPATISVKAGQTFSVTATAKDVYGNTVPAGNGLPVTVTVPTTGASATPSATTFTATAVDTFTENATLGSYAITLTSGSLSGTTQVTATGAADAFIVAVLTDPTTGIAARCVNQTAGSSYNTGATTNAACSLRDAIVVANATSGANITFAAGLATTAAPATIPVVSALAVTAPTTIVGPGSGALSLNRTGNFGYTVNVTASS